MSKSVGKSVTRVDAYEKATGRAKYVADLCDQSALVARILHATIAHGYVKSIDTTEAEAVPGRRARHQPGAARDLPAPARRGARGARHDRQEARGVLRRVRGGHLEDAPRPA